MSSFICSAKHFNSIEKSLENLTHSNNFYFPYSIKEYYPEIYDYRKTEDSIVKDAITKIVDTLRELNVLCVCLQYKHHYEGVLNKEIEEQMTIVKMKDRGEHLTKIALFKALRCVNYQIELHHLKELRKLTIEESHAMFFIKIMIDGLAQDIVDKLPEYDKAKWEIN